MASDVHGIMNSVFDIKHARTDSKPRLVTKKVNEQVMKRGREKCLRLKAENAALNKTKTLNALRASATKKEAAERLGVSVRALNARLRSYKEPTP